MSSDLSTRFDGIRARIAAASARAGRSAEPTLIAVSKGQGVDAIEALYKLGQRDFGENYAQELSEKAETLASRGCSEIRWHFIGHLQTNKIKYILPWIQSLHTVDSDKLAVELEKRWKASGRAGRLPVFAEINIDAEESKSGLLPQTAANLVIGFAEKYPALEFQGLMCVPSAESDEAALRRSFVLLRSIEAACRPHTAGKLSMGMSSDFELAIAEGATHVRVGTALFGPRAPKG